MRACYACRKLFELSSDNFYKRNSRPSGFMSQCKSCSKAYSMARSLTKRRPRKSLEKRFFEKVYKIIGECWLWTGSKIRGGYGSFSVNNVATTAHRVSYELSRGAIPQGLHIDHLCGNRNCVNPEHLEAVTQAENNRRTAQRRSGAKLTVNATRD